MFQTVRTRLKRPSGALILGLVLLGGTVTACSEAADEPIINSGSGEITVTEEG